MQAVWYTRFGPASEVLQAGERDTPEPAKGQVRVRLAVSGVNPVDIKRRRGARGAMDTSTVIPGFDGAGVIDKVGKGVPDSRLGERVWVCEAQWNRPFGTAAEYVTVPAGRAVKLPDRAKFEEGASLGIPAMTAHRCVFADGPVQRKRILVTGGAGSVGSYAVQFARLAGAEVLATVSGEQKAAWARECGARHVINYKIENVPERVREITQGEGVDRVVDVDFGANLMASLEVLKTNGVISSYASDARLEPTLPFYQFAYKNVTVHCELVFLMPEGSKQQAFSDLTRWMEEGKLRHHISQRFPLEKCAAAHEAMEAGAFGKVVLEIDTRSGSV
ncbi:MAG: NADPH:quinone reductase [Acidobacteriota bacterium]